MIEEKTIENLKQICLQITTCGVCRCIMVDPVPLNCGHVFCYSCIEKWHDRYLQQNMQEKQDEDNEDEAGTTFPCPICRTHVCVPNRKQVHPLYDLMFLANAIDPIGCRERNREIYQEQMMNRLVMFPSREYDCAQQRLWPYELVTLMCYADEFPVSTLGAEMRFVYLDYQTRLKVLTTIGKNNNKYKPGLIGLTLKILAMSNSLDSQQRVITIYTAYVEGRCKINNIYPYERQLRVDYAVLDNLVHPHLLIENTLFYGSEIIHLHRLDDDSEVTISLTAQNQLGSFYNAESSTNYITFAMHLMIAFQHIRTLNINVPGFNEVEDTLAKIVDQEYYPNEPAVDLVSNLDRLSWYMFRIFSHRFGFEYKSHHYVISLVLDRQKLFKSRSIAYRVEQSMAMMEKLYLLLHQITIENQLSKQKLKKRTMSAPVRRSLRIRTTLHNQ